MYIQLKTIGVVYWYRGYTGYVMHYMYPKPWTCLCGRVIVCIYYDRPPALTPSLLLDLPNSIKGDLIKAQVDCFGFAPFLEGIEVNTALLDFVQEL